MGRVQRHPEERERREVRQLGQFSCGTLEGKSCKNNEYSVQSFIIANADLAIHSMTDLSDRASKHESCESVFS